MKTIQTKIIDEVITPLEPFPKNAISIYFDGLQYIIYESGDVVPSIDYKDNPVIYTDKKQEIIDSLTEEQIKSGLINKINSFTVEEVVKEVSKQTGKDPSEIVISPDIGIVVDALVVNETIIIDPKDIPSKP